MEPMIPSDDPVRLLNAFVEGIDLSELYKTYDRVRKNQASPRQMFKIMAIFLHLTCLKLDMSYNQSHYNYD